MSCPKCKEAKTPYCGLCGSRIEAIIVCPWCKTANDVENSFCHSCGKKIKFAPFSYSKRTITRKEMLRELLRSNTRFNEDRIKRFISNMEFYKDCQCPNCGEINEIAGVRQRDLLGFFDGLKITLGESVIQAISEPNVEHDGVEEIVVHLLN